MTTLAHAPQFSSDEAARFARDLYNLAVTAVLLPSERDQNFYLTAADGRQLVLKIANAQEDPAMLAAQQLALAVVGEANGRLPQ